jgi:hypothetical protein
MEKSTYIITGSFNDAKSVKKLWLEYQNFMDSQDNSANLRRVLVAKIFGAFEANDHQNFFQVFEDCLNDVKTNINKL